MQSSLRYRIWDVDSFDGKDEISKLLVKRVD